jgi:hypothetical protein
VLRDLLGMDERALLGLAQRGVIYEAAFPAEPRP